MKITKPQFNTKNINVAFVGLIALFVKIYCAFKFNPDSDAFFLIETGRYIVKSGSFPEINPWTMHDGIKIVVQQWLCCIANYKFFDWFGYSGLTVLALIESVICFICFYAYARLFSVDRSNAFLKTSILWGMTYMVTSTRPYLITISTTLLILYCLEMSRKTEKSKYAITVVFLVMFQANWQISMIIFPFLFMTLYLLSAVLNHRDDLSLKMSLMLAVSFGSALVNPYGVDGVLYLFKSYTPTLNAYIQELQAPIVGGKFGALILASLLVLSYRMYRFKRDKVYLDAVYALLLGGAIGMAIMNIRSYWMILVCIVPFLPDIVTPKERKPNLFTTASVFLVIITTIVCLIIVFGEGPAQQQALIERSTFPNITSYLDEHAEKGDTMFAEFSAGQYFQFLGYKTFMDARPELYTEAINGVHDYWNEYVSIMYLGEGIEEFFNMYDFDYIEAKDNSTVGLYLEYSGDYEKLAEDEEGSLWVRKE